MTTMPILALLLSAAQPICPPQTLQGARFTPGEVLNYRIDVLGVDVGTFEVRTQAPPSGDKRAALELTSRAKTSAFVSTNAGQYEAYATTLVTGDMLPLRYHEDVDDGPVHRGAELEFPPAGGAAPVKATKNGEPEPFTLPASPALRDMISTFYVLRAQSLGAPVCFEVFAGRKVWKVVGTVAAREKISTPLGKYATLRVDMDAVRTDDAHVRRTAHVWVTDDEKRIPMVAVGEMRGKVLRAQLVSTSGTRRRVGDMMQRPGGRALRVP
jgi:hypothetical protein